MTLTPGEQQRLQWVFLGVAAIAFALGWLVGWLVT